MTPHGAEKGVAGVGGEFSRVEMRGGKRFPTVKIPKKLHCGEQDVEVNIATCFGQDLKNFNQQWVDASGSEDRDRWKVADDALKNDAIAGD